MSTGSTGQSHELRRVRFADIGGLTREDLPLACEVWLDDLARAAWGTRDATKLGVYLMRYIIDSNRTPMTFSEIERRLQMDRKYLMQSLVLMRTYAAVVDFAVDKDDLKVSINLSLLQRLRVLEGQRRLSDLAAWRRETSDLLAVQPGEGWVPESAYQETEPAIPPPAPHPPRRIRRLRPTEAAVAIPADPSPPVATPLPAVTRATIVQLDWAERRRLARSGATKQSKG